MDQYCILGRIGEGAHGIVFKAKHVEVSWIRVGRPGLPLWVPLISVCEMYPFPRPRLASLRQPSLLPPLCGVCSSL